MYRLIGVLTSLVVVAVMFAGVSPAQAQIETSVTCVFEGLSGTLNAGTSAHGVHGHGIQNIGSELNRGELLDIERGSYSFTTEGGAAEAVCAVEFNGLALVEDNATITSDGFYDNILCGTGFAHDLTGDGTEISNGTWLQIGPGELGYDIWFKKGVGDLIIGPDGRPSYAGLTETLPPDQQVAAHGAHDPDADTDGDGTVEGGEGMHGDIESEYTGDGLVVIEAGNQTLPTIPGVTPQDDNCRNERDPEAGNLDQFGDTDDFQVEGYFTAERSFP